MNKIASIDIGLKRIGVAISMDEKIVFPKRAILRKNRKQASLEVSSFLKEWNIKRLIVGIPKGGNSEKEMKLRVEHFVNLLNFEGDIFYQDEYGSSYEAKELAKGITKDKRDGKIDSLAAKIILERWIESQQSHKVL